MVKSDRICSNIKGMTLKKTAVRLLLVAAALLVLAAGSYGAARWSRQGSLSAFTAHLESKPEKSYEEITPSLLPVLQHQRSYQFRTFQEIRDHYLRYFQTLAANYPAGTFTFRTFRILQSFSGRKTIDSVTSYFTPYYLLCAQVYDPDRIRYDRFQVSFRERTIQGLRITSVIHPLLLRSSGTVLAPLLYTQDINARIFGFTHAQLIPSLSQNARPAEQFRYNELQTWEKHRRYRQLDQVSAPLRMTNYAHGRGDHYLVSDHPDFAIELENYRTAAAVLTFFLWDRGLLGTQIGRMVPLPEQLPDFILELRFNTPNPE